MTAATTDLPDAPPRPADPEPLTGPAFEALCALAGRAAFGPHASNAHAAHFDRLAVVDGLLTDAAFLVALSAAERGAVAGLPGFDLPHLYGEPNAGAARFAKSVRKLLGDVAPAVAGPPLKVVRVGYWPNPHSEMVGRGRLDAKVLASDGARAAWFDAGLWAAVCELRPAAPRLTAYADRSLAVWPAADGTPAALLMSLRDAA